MGLLTARAPNGWLGRACVAAAAEGAERDRGQRDEDQQGQRAAEGVADGKRGEIRSAAVGKVAQRLRVVRPSVAGVGRRHPDREDQQAPHDPAPQRGAGPRSDGTARPRRQCGDATGAEQRDDQRDEDPFLQGAGRREDDQPGGADHHASHRSVAPGGDLPHARPARQRQRDRAVRDEHGHECDREQPRWCVSSAAAPYARPGAHDRREGQQHRSEDEQGGYDAAPSRGRPSRARGACAAAGTCVAAYSSPDAVRRYKCRGGRPAGASASHRDSSSSRSESRTRIGYSEPDRSATSSPNS